MQIQLLMLIYNTWSVCLELSKSNKCNILTFDQAVNWEGVASRYSLNLWTGWIRCNCDAHGKRVCGKQVYNPVPQTVELVGVSYRWSSSCSSRQWEPAPSRGLGPSGPQAEQPRRIRKKCCYGQRNLGSICCSLFNSPLTHNPFVTLSNKV